MKRDGKQVTNCPPITADGICIMAGTIVIFISGWDQSIDQWMWYNIKWGTTWKGWKRVVSNPNYVATSTTQGGVSKVYLGSVNEWTTNLYFGMSGSGMSFRIFNTNNDLSSMVCKYDDTYTNKGRITVTTSLGTFEIDADRFTPAN